MEQKTWIAGQARNDSLSVIPAQAAIQVVHYIMPNACIFQASQNLRSGVRLTR